MILARYRSGAFRHDGAFEQEFIFGQLKSVYRLQARGGLQLAVRHRSQAEVSKFNKTAGEATDHTPADESGCRKHLLNQRRDRIDALRPMIRKIHWQHARFGRPNRWPPGPSHIGATLPHAPCCTRRVGRVGDTVANRLHRSTPAVFGYRPSTREIAPCPAGWVYPHLDFAASEGPILGQCGDSEEAREK